MKRTVNPRSLENLHSWQKGQSGNPGGRPKRVISEAYQAKLLQVHEKKRVNPRSLENLRPYRKGQSGNPGGRPKSLISESTRDWLKEVHPKTGKSNAEMVALALGKRALKGDTGAFCALRDTTEGRPAQTQQHEIISSSPVRVKIEAPDLVAALRQIYGLGSGNHDAGNVQPTSGVEFTEG